MTASTDEVAGFVWRKIFVCTPYSPANLPGQRNISRRQEVRHMTGEIKRLDRSRGFGFIRPEGASEDVFFTWRHPFSPPPALVEAYLRTNLTE